MARIWKQTPKKKLHSLKTAVMQTMLARKEKRLESWNNYLKNKTPEQLQFISKNFGRITQEVLERQQNLIVARNHANTVFENSAKKLRAIIKQLKDRRLPAAEKTAAAKNLLNIYNHLELVFKELKQSYGLIENAFSKNERKEWAAFFENMQKKQPEPISGLEKALMIF